MKVIKNNKEFEELYIDIKENQIVLANKIDAFNKYYAKIMENNVK